MQHAVDQTPALHATSSAQQQDLTPAMVSDTTSLSSTSSPKSLKTSLDPNASQVSESTLASVAANELTPPSSVASSQEQHEASAPLADGAHEGGAQISSAAIGKKRTANGEVKNMAKQQHTLAPASGTGHARSSSSLSQPALGELSQQLKTKLTYAMVKVQNGWQKHSLDEIESIASQSPRSTFSNVAAREYQSLVSPRAALTASKRQNSGSSHSSNQSTRQQPYAGHASIAQAIDTSPRKALAPPAPIVSGNRRRPTPNVPLQINSSLRPSPRPIRPTTTQRTPSQNAAMEADAVETLLFMSASPNNSGHFPSHLSAYSPTSQVFSAQASPMKLHFSPNNRGHTALNAYSPRSPRRRSRYESKTALIDRLLHDLDDDESEELDRAVKIIEQHHATKLST